MKYRELIPQLDYGATEGELDEAIATVANAVKEQQKRGSITLTLTFDPVKHNEAQVEITESIKVVTPQRGRASTTMFIQKDGSLSRRDPRQPELPMQPGERPRAVVMNPDGASVETETAVNG